MFLILTAATLLVSVSACGQGTSGAAKAAPEAASRFWVTTPADSLLAETVLSDLAGHAGETVAELMIRAGKSMEGQPYVAGTLDESPEELRIYLTKTDCIIFNNNTNIEPFIKSSAFYFIFNTIGFQSKFVRNFPF